MIIPSVFSSNICFWLVKETSPRDVSFTHQKHMFILTIKIVINMPYSLNPSCP